MSGKQQTKFTPSQQNVINSRGRDMLVSASAGTGKTTVMIERIAALLNEGADISQIVVVTFTNLAAAEMKNRLARKLSENCGDRRVLDQLERIDSASICTLHSFCGELVRNYFYVTDIDPSYTILDANLIANLRKSAMEDVFARYYDEKDETFKKVHKIFSKSRQQSNFIKVLYGLYDFSKCIADFPAWYEQKKNNLTNLNDGSPVIESLRSNIEQNVNYYRKAMLDLRDRSQSENLVFAATFAENAEKLNGIRIGTLGDALADLYTFKLSALPSRNKNKNFGVNADVDKAIEESVRYDYEQLADGFEKFSKRYNELSRGLDIQTLREQTYATVELLDKLVEIVARFEEVYFVLKKDRGGLDFNDLEHLALQVLNDGEAISDIRSKYKMIFIDEYQDTNPVQEAIISKLAACGNLFMVGDVKQSIYGFRGCEPNIFVDKYRKFKTENAGEAVELNDNFRSNVHVLDFVNEVFGVIMTDGFGKVNYKEDAQLRGQTPPVLSVPSVRIDFVVPSAKEKREITDVYDITADEEDTDLNLQAELIVRRVKEYVGKTYEDKNGQKRRIEYGDIVILLRTFQDKALNIYNALISANVPVAASFNVDGYASKEIKDIINLLRVLDNPYNDLYLTGVALSCFGNLTESELGCIRLDTNGRVPLYERMKQYSISRTNEAVANKADKLLKLINELTFYSRSASVSELAIKTIELTNYHLYVQGLPNGGLRLRKMYNFIDGVKDVSYAQSIDRFLAFLDEAEENPLDAGVSGSNAVRMMTMHASKGLEFPVVIIADIEHRFRKDESAIDCNFDMGLAMKYYDFGSMTYAPTLASTAFGMFNRIKSNEEQMRLLYVAMTRAKYALDIVGTVSEKQLNSIPKLPQDAVSHLDWILTALKQTRGKNINSLHDNVQINVFDHVEKDEQTGESLEQMCRQETDEQAVTDKINYVYAFESQKNMPSKIVSSALDKAYVDVSDLPEVTLVQNDDRNFVGTAYHKVYQYVDFCADKEKIKQTVESLTDSGIIEKRFADMLDVNLIYDTLNNPELKKIRSVGQAYREIPFMLYVPYNSVVPNGEYADEVMLQGVIDLLVIGDDKAVVVDFKYTSRPSKIVQNYSAQLNSYKLAVKKICGIQNVECYALSVADNKLVKF